MKRPIQIQKLRAVIRPQAARRTAQALPCFPGSSIVACGYLLLPDTEASHGGRVPRLAVLSEDALVARQ
jgi:hypothetical protein